MKRVAAKIAPKLLNFEEKHRRIDIAQEIMATFNDNSDLLKKVIGLILFFTQMIAFSTILYVSKALVDAQLQGSIPY